MLTGDVIGYAIRNSEYTRRPRYPFPRNLALYRWRRWSGGSLQRREVPDRHGDGDTPGAQGEEPRLRPDRAAVPGPRLWLCLCRAGGVRAGRRRGARGVPHGLAQPGPTSRAGGIPRVAEADRAHTVQPLDARQAAR